MSVKNNDLKGIKEENQPLTFSLLLKLLPSTHSTFSKTFLKLGISLWTNKNPSYSCPETFIKTTLPE
jgi:hypothetical protein